QQQVRKSFPPEILPRETIHCASQNKAGCQARGETALRPATEKRSARNHPVAQHLQRKLLLLRPPHGLPARGSLFYINPCLILSNKNGAEAPFFISYLPPNALRCGTF